jgi:hypothetical protein
MGALYVTSTEPYAGKTAVCLALAKQLQAGGRSVGYLKPLSTQPWRTPAGQLSDEDTDFVRRTLGLDQEQSPDSPVIVTAEVLRERLAADNSEDLIQSVVDIARSISEQVDLLMLEGGASLREGYAMGLSNLQIAESLGAPVLVLVRCHQEMQVLDDALAARFRLGEQMLGVVLNHVSEGIVQFLEQSGGPYLERHGIRLLGTLPRRPRLSALSVGELVELLGAKIETKNYDPEALIESFTVGAMTAEAALSRFRRQQNKAVITGGDRSDIQLAALETSTVALILTGNLQPSPVVVQQAEGLGIPILLVDSNTMEAVDRIEQTYSRTRLGQPEKLASFMQLMEQHVNSQAIFEALGLG